MLSELTILDKSQKNENRTYPKLIRPTSWSANCCVATANTEVAESSYMLQLHKSWLALTGHIKKACLKSN